MPGRIFGFSGGVAPSNKINLFHIGMGNRGNELLGAFLGNPNYQILGVCDCYKAHLDRAAARVNNHYRNEAAAKYAHYEDVLQRDDVDAICCATPDHWHTKISVEACQAGKDVFCEKPLTLTLQESRIIVKAARKYNRVCSSGSQRVMEDYGYMYHSAKRRHRRSQRSLRRARRPAKTLLPARTTDSGRVRLGSLAGQRPTPVQQRALRELRRRLAAVYRIWKRVPRRLGRAQIRRRPYALGMDLEEPVELLPAGYDGSKYVCAVFKNGLKMHHAWHGPFDITFKGTEGEYSHNQTKMNPLKPVEVRRYSGGAWSINDDFAFCARNRLRPFQDFAYGAVTASLCQLLAICHKLNRRLEWDSANCRFVNDDEANRHVQRVQRAPYAIPEV